ncbi:MULTISPECIES: NACHT domain-containing protein [Actinosynnema]|uniref:NACHT domain-containing protein n=1 Tax=Actinosynnema TaxID=40566 RepID=UPI0020A4B141|nr:NACHT domain-containing protein [Actinosynnema pretiosum]MCP2094252.1 NACHT domain-containing protein [Actinosynnema pretiosum]
MDSRQLARTARTAALSTVGAVVLLVLVPTAFNAATGGSAPRVLGPLAPWLWPALAGLCAVAGVLVAWEPLAERWRQRRPHHPANREAALERVERFVRAERERALAAQVRLKLGVAPKVGPSLPTRMRAPLVVVGEAGAGKTTLLLELAEALLERARDDGARPLPVVVDLATWRGDTGFTEWLLARVESRYRISPRLGRVWLEDRRFALLFDGLDELSAAERARCLAEVSALGVAQFALCSRDADLPGLPEHEVVRVEPVRRGDVQALLAACGPRVAGLRDELEKQPDLWTELRTPLALGLLVLARRAGRVDYRRGVLDTYVAEAVSRVPRAERLLRALRFQARVAAAPQHRDLVARGRLPHRTGWLGFVGPDVVRRLFARVAPGALAGALAAACLVVGVAVGVLPAVVLALGSAALPWGRFPVGRGSAGRGRGRRSGRGQVRDRGELLRGFRWAATGFVVGAVVTGVFAAGGGLLVWLITPWPWALRYGLVVAVAFGLALALLRDLYWAIACALVPASVMVLTGPSESLLVALGSALAAAAVVGVFLGGVEEVWAGLPADWERVDRVPGGVVPGEVVGGAASGDVSADSVAVGGTAPGSASPADSASPAGSASSAGSASAEDASPDTTSLGGTSSGDIGAEELERSSFRAGTGFGVAVSGAHRWLPGAGALGVVGALGAGAVVDPGVALAPSVGVLVGLLVLPLVVRPVDRIAELLAKPLALDELPLGRGALAQTARDRLLLVGDQRFPHAVVRDHLAACDPVDLAELARQVRPGGASAGSGGASAGSGGASAGSGGASAGR